MGQKKISNLHIVTDIKFNLSFYKFNNTNQFSSMGDEPLGEDHDFESVSAGASETFPQQCSALRKNGYVMIKGRPCKIVEMSTSKTGKHGHAKVHLVALDIFTGQKKEDICPSTHNMQVPNVKRDDYQLIDIDDGMLNLMDDKGETKDDIKCPDDEIGEEIKTRHANEEDIMVTILSALDEEKAVGTKTMTK